MLQREIKIARKKCPNCGGSLREKINGHDGKRFLGCSSFQTTGCNFTISYAEYFDILNSYKSFKLKSE